jgi:hypothetical protein
MQIKLPGDLLQYLNLNGQKQFTDLLSGDKFTADDIHAGVYVTLAPSSGRLLNF